MQLKCCRYIVGSTGDWRVLGTAVDEPVTCNLHSLNGNNIYMQKADELTERTYPRDGVSSQSIH